MIGWLLVTTVLAGTTVETETRAQVRHDLFGDRLAPVHQYVSFDSRQGDITVRGFGSVRWVHGLERAVDPDIFSLHAVGRTERGTWWVGRQQAATLMRPQTVDGARYTWSTHGPLTFDAWGGVARHQDLDDLLDGVGMARLVAHARGERWHLRAGGQVEAGPDTPFVARQDLEGMLDVGSFHRPTRLRAVVGVAEPDFTVEWARLEVATPPVANLDATVHVERREAPHPQSIFGDTILQDLAGGATRSGGLTLRAHGPRWAVLSMGWRTTATELADARLGHAIDLRYMPGRGQGSFLLMPAYTFRTGPGGTFHAFSALGRTSLGDAQLLRARAALVPYRKPHTGWQLALDAGVEAERPVTRDLSAGLSVDFASGVVHQADLRVGAMLRARLP